MATTGSLTFDTLRQFAAEITGEKRANSDPGGVSGSSSGPWTSVEDGTRPATTGARAAENEADIKKNPEGEVSVDATTEPDAQTDHQDEVQYNINMTQSAVGEDPAVEDDYKSTKDDPGTSSPFTVADGEKYGSWNFGKCAGELGRLGNEILAELTVEAAQAQKAAGKKPAPAASKEVRTPAPAAAAADAVQKAAQAGYDQAAALGAAGEAEAAQRFLYNTVKEAAHMADLTAEYMTEFARIKQAEAEEGDGGGEKKPEPKQDDGGGDAPAGPGGPPPADAGGAGGGDALAAMLGPGGGAPGGDAAAPPPGAGGDPLAGGAPPGGPSKEEALHELAAAMIEMHITPEELLQAVSAMQPDQGPQVQKLANEVKAYRRSGKFSFGEPKTARQKALRAEMRSFLQEIVAA